MKQFGQYLLLFFKGAAMGAADSIPGVSGGTIAFITGIYERLITALKSIHFESLSLIFKGRFKRFWELIDGNFLLTVFSGLIISLLFAAKVIVFLLENYEIQTWSFFFGLILISSVLVLRELHHWSAGVAVSIILGIAVSYYVTIATPATTPDTLWFIFVSAAMAICAMILPGISGAFILLLLGQYEQVLTALNNRELVTILVFVSGAGIGLISFVRLLSWLLNRFHNIAIGVLSGFMIGSLNKIWPWKEITRYRINSKGEQVPFLDKNISPIEYGNLGQDPVILQAFLYCSLAIGIVVLIEFINFRIEKQQQKRRNY